MDSLDTLLAQAKRLRFADPAREQRFLRAHLAEGLGRVRWGIGCAIVYTLVLGVVDFSPVRAYPDPWLLQHLLTFRFGIQLPIWLGLAALAWRRNPPLTLDLWLALGVSAVAAWMPVFYIPFGRTTALVILSGQMLPLLLLSAIILPVRFRGTVVMAFTYAGLGPALTDVFGAGQLRQSAYQNFSADVLYAAVIALAGYLRERGDRRQFAQHEHVVALNTELARLNAERAEFMAIAAHDLRAPLGAVRLTAAHAQADATVAPAHRELFTDIAGAATRMGGIVDSFLSAHAAESGSIPVSLAPLDATAAAAEAVRRHAAAAAQKNQSLRHEPSALAPAAALVRADAALLAQVLDNFVSNAIKFTPAGSAIGLAARAGDTPGTLRLAVRDNGPGLTAADRARAFGKFARLTARPTAGEASTGLGLAVTRRLAAAMRGTVGVDDAPGGGAEFWIELPATAPGEPAP